MDRTRDAASGRSDYTPEERWLRESLAPEADAAQRTVSAALTADVRPRRLLRGALGYAAAAGLALCLGALLVGKPGPAPVSGPEPSAAGSVLLTNASGAVRLVRRAPEAEPLPPLVRPTAAEGCTTMYWSRGSVLAVYESCGDGTIRIEGGAS